MDEGSPIALDLSYQFNDDILGDRNNPNNPNSIGGLPISHEPPDAARDYSIDGSHRMGPAHHQHKASLVSIDSVVEHSTNSASAPADMQQKFGGNVHSTMDGNNKGEEVEQDQTPTWSELKTKAGKERKRLPLACIACRRKKIKCSGEKPACKHCLKARIPCVYKVTTRKAAPRTDYMAMLDKRLKRMEDRVIRILPSEDLPDISHRSSVRPPLPGSNSKEDKSNEKSKRSAEEAFDHDLKDWARGRTGSTQLDNAARIKSQRDSDNKLFSEGYDALPPKHLQEHLAEVFFDCVYGQSYLLLHKPSFMRKLKADAVPPVLILAVCAISARFSTHPQVSTEPAFLRGEQWATPARTIVEKRHFEPNITVLTCMVILGLHYFGTCEGGLSWSFGGQAMRMGYALQLHKELDHDPLGLAQAERAAASGKPVPQMQELSFTDREIRRRTMWACFLMDTFNSSGSERPSFLNEDYMFIQLPIKESHFRMEVPSHTEDLDGHVPLRPSRSSLEDHEAEAKANMGVAAYVIRAVVIWKRVVQYLNLGGKEKDAHPIWDPLSQFANLQRQIGQLKASLPSSLQYNQDNLQAHITERLANQFIFLHIVLAQNSLFLHRFAIPTEPNTHRPYHPSTPKPFLSTAATTVLEAASTISKLLADSTGHTLVVPFAGYCAYASATVHVWGIFSKNVGLENSSRENLRHNYKYLNRMKRYWGMFHYMTESIKDTYRAFADAASRGQRRQQGMPRPTPSGRVGNLESGAIAAEQQSRAASPRAENDIEEDSSRKKSDDKVKLFQYGDWFNKYPHGVSEDEWEQKRLPHRSETQEGTEAVMSQQAELQSVEEFFASLSPPSKADDGPNRKKAARKRGKSMAEEKAKQRGSNAGETNREQSGKARTQSKSGNDMPPHRQSVTSNSLYPRSDRTLTQLDLSTSELDVPMAGVSAGLQSGHGNSAFDLTSPTAMLSTASLDSPYQFPSMAGPTSNPNQVQHRTQSQSGLSPFDYTSPSSSNAGSNTNNASAMNYNFNYSSAVPQLDRHMVYGGYAGIDPSTSGSTNALNNINNLDFWSNPWEGGAQVDMDGFNGFNDPTFGLNSGTRVMGNERGNEDDEQKRHAAQRRQQNLGHTHNNSQNQNMSSTAWFMPFNIDPPQPSNFNTGNTPGGLEEFAEWAPMVDIEGFNFSPRDAEQQHDGG